MDLHQGSYFTLVKESWKDSGTTKRNWPCNRAAHPRSWFLNSPCLMHERDVPKRLIFDMDVPCVVEWCFPWYSAPTRTHSDLVNEGRPLETYSLETDVAPDSAFKFPSSKIHPPRLLLLTSQRLMTIETYCAG